MNIATPLSKAVIGGRIGRRAAIANMSLALDTLMAIIHADEDVPRMALFYGPSGYGKSIACAYAAAVTDAVYLQASSVWTGKTFLEKLAHELGITRLGRTASAVLDQIIDASTNQQRPLIIDEMDYLVNKRQVEIIRDIYEATGNPILMVGEEALPAKLKEWERFDNRILLATAAQPASIDDGRLLRDLYATRVKIADDLVDYIVTECSGITRRVVANLQNAQRIAIEELETDAIDRAAWGRRRVSNGNTLPRRLAAAA